MKKVMIFGTFDSIEDRHRHLFERAAEHGDGVMAVLSRDESNSDLQQELTLGEYDRLVQMMNIDVVDDVILEHDSKVEIIRTHRPDIIMIGTHQEHIAEELHAFSDDMHACGCVIVYV